MNLEFFEVLGGVFSTTKKIHARILANPTNKQLLAQQIGPSCISRGLLLDGDLQRYEA